LRSWRLARLRQQLQCPAVGVDQCPAGCGPAPSWRRRSRVDHRIKRFFTLWLSITVALGLAPRPTRSRRTSQGDDSPALRSRHRGSSRTSDARLAESCLATSPRAYATGDAEIGQHERRGLCLHRSTAICMQLELTRRHIMFLERIVK
jgi:hypothetical protein